MSEEATYDIAVSFTDDRQSYVEEVVDACKQRGMTVLYDAGMTNGWWLDNPATDVQVRYFVPFVSSPVDDFSATVLKAVKHGEARILPVLVGDVPVDQELLHPHILYLRSEKRTPDQLADRFSTKADSQQPTALADVLNRIFQPAQAAAIPEDFSKYAEQGQALSYLGYQFQAVVPQLRSQGFVGTVQHTESRVVVRIERRGDTVYALEVQRGGLGGDETVNFVVGLHDPSSTCSNGWARPVYDKESGEARLELHDLSLLGGTQHRTYTKAELFYALWSRITTQLAEATR